MPWSLKGTFAAWHDANCWEVGPDANANRSTKAQSEPQPEVVTAPLRLGDRRVTARAHTPTPNERKEHNTPWAFTRRS